MGFLLNRAMIPKVNFESYLSKSDNNYVDSKVEIIKSICHEYLVFSSIRANRTLPAETLTLSSSASSIPILAKTATVF